MCSAVRHRLYLHTLSPGECPAEAKGEEAVPRRDSCNRGTNICGDGHGRKGNTTNGESRLALPATRSVSLVRLIVQVSVEVRVRFFLDLDLLTPHIAAHGPLLSLGLLADADLARHVGLLADKG